MIQRGLFRNTKTLSSVSDPIYKNGSIVGREFHSGGWIRIAVEDLTGTFRYTAMTASGEAVCGGGFKTRAAAMRVAHQMWKEKS